MKYSGCINSYTKDMYIILKIKLILQHCTNKNKGTNTSKDQSSNIYFSYYFG